MDAKVISFINMKGGVGKTTLTIGLAACLASHNHRVLVIDADPQFNATQSLLDDYKKQEAKEIQRERISELDAEDPAVRHVPDDVDDSEYNYYNREILNGRDDDKQSTIYRLFTTTRRMGLAFQMPGKEIITKLTDNLSLLCGDLSLVLANKMIDYQLVLRIKKFIDANGLRSEFEYILIDCPPTLTIYTDSALLASDYYIIPNRIDRYSIIGIDSLQESIANLFENENDMLPCLGIIYTMVPTSLGKKQEKIKSSFESKKVVEDLDIFSSVSHKVDAIQSGASGTNPMSYKTSKADMESIVSELIERIKSAHGGEGK